MENKNDIGNFLNYSSNQMVKTQNKEKITLTIFKKAHQKINEKNTFLALTNLKKKIFSKF
jgi:hypothetical protein